jgi:acyl-CoA synthetase (AMP-forming)/AMP-acid ligase II
MQSTMMQIPLSINYCLQRGAQIYGNRRVVSRLPDRSVRSTSFAATAQRARRLAAALNTAGIARGDRVAVLMTNHAWHIECYFGVPAVGAVYHPLNFRLSGDDIVYIINNAEDRILIIDEPFLPLYEQIKTKLRLERVIVNAFSKRARSDSFDDYEHFISADASAPVFQAVDENEAAGLCYTSGTTGRPKGVAYSHRSTVLHSLSLSLPDVLGISAHDTILAITPLFHANGWGIPAAAMMLGANMVFPGQHTAPADLLDMMERECVTFALGVPTIWTAVLAALEESPERWKLTPARLMVGGSAAPPTLLKRLDQFGLRIVHGWGMTEMSPVGSISFLQPQHEEFPVEARLAIRARQGVAVPLVELRLMGEHGELPWDGKSAGELQARGPFVTGSYYRSEHSDEKFTADGWLRTGDTAMIDPESYLQIVDREKDLIKSGGEWISSVDLENAIMAHPDVLEAAVVAIAHPEYGERPLAVVVKKPDHEITPEALQQFVRPRFARWQVPDDWVFVEALPKTSTGKFMKHKLRADYSDYVSKTPSIRTASRSDAVR